MHTHTYTHTHTTATMHTLHTLHSHAHTNQGCTKPGAEPPTYTLATCSPTYTHTHKANITTPSVLVCHSLLAPDPGVHQSALQEKKTTYVV